MNRVSRFCSFAVLLCVLFTAVFGSVCSADTLTNIAAGKSYTVEFAQPIDNAFPAKAYKPEGKLTDGLTASASLGDSNWLHLYRGMEVSVTIDLGETMAVGGFEMSMLNYNSAGVHPSMYVNMLVSTDGVSFSTVLTCEDSDSVWSQKNAVIDYSANSDTLYSARYVRLVFNSMVNTYVDEIAVYGKESDGSETVAVPDNPTEYKNSFCSEVDGNKNIVLLYTGEYYGGSKTGIGSLSAEQIKPYFAYTDATGNVSDTMFDSILFLPLFPGDDFDYSFQKADGWEAYIDNLLGTESGTNISALDKLVDEYRTVLGLSDDYTYPIYVAIPYVEFSATDVFDATGVRGATRPDGLDSRLSIVKWFVDEFISRLDASGIKNVSLEGFYWYCEGIGYADSDHEAAFVTASNDYVHSLGYSSIWIPYYGSPGVDHWEELGFDAVTLQPGYAFDSSNSVTGKRDPACVEDTIEYARKYGLGLEFELGSNCTTLDEFNVYYRYLYDAWRLGVMEDGITMYYQGGGPGSYYTMSHSYNSFSRRAYDLTYKFLKKDFASYSPVIEEGQIIEAVSGKKTAGKLVVTDDDSKSSDLDVYEISGPGHGKLTIEGDGFYVYTSESGYTGEDSFVFSVTDGFGVSDTVTVTITVTSASEPGNSESSAVDISEESSNGFGRNIVLIVCITIAGAVLAAATVYVVLARRRNKK